MEYFIFSCLSVVLLFGFALIISTICMGKNCCVALQVLMGSLRYSKDVDDKLDLVLGKIDAGMYHVYVATHTIELYSKELYPDFNPNSRFGCKPEMEIWIGNRFYSYGYIYRMNNGEAPRELREKRPSVKIIKQIYELERSNGESTSRIKKDKTNAKTVVLE